MRVSSEVEKPRVFGGGGEEWGLVGSAKEEVTGRVGQVGLDQEVPPRSQLCPNLPAQWSEMGELSLSVKAWACFFSPQPAVLSLLLSVANCQPSLGALASPTGPALHTQVQPARRTASACPGARHPASSGSASWTALSRVTAEVSDESGYWRCSPLRPIVQIKAAFSRSTGRMRHSPAYGTNSFPSQRLWPLKPPMLSHLPLPLPPCYSHCGRKLVFRLCSC